MEASRQEPPIRILVVDDQVLIRQSLLHLLMLEEEQIQIMAMASDGLEAIALIEQYVTVGRPPHVVLMDIQMPGLDGIQATSYLQARWPDVPVVLMTTFADEASYAASRQAGAKGYILKDTSAPQLVSILHAVAHGTRLFLSNIHPFL